jgi:hypothetical protein
MTLSERITEDMKGAMKSGEKLKLETLRTVRAQFIEFSKRGSDKPVTPDDELAILLGAIKKRKEAIDLYQQAGRKELVDRESREMEILQAYLPQQISREDADGLIKGIIREAGASSPKDFGKVMGRVMKELKGKLDGTIVQELVKKNLGG